MSHDPSPFTLRQPLPDNTLNSPINFDWEGEDKENKDPADPGLPFFPNNPTSPHYYPLYIHLKNPAPNSPARVSAKYIFYHNQGQEVVGCMGKGEPWYSDLVYLNALHPTRIAVPMTNLQLKMFHPEDSHTYIIDKAMGQLDQPHLTAEVSYLHKGLVRRTQVWKQLDNLQRQELQLQHVLFTVDMEIGRV